MPREVKDSVEENWAEIYKSMPGDLGEKYYLGFYDERGYVDANFWSMNGIEWIGSDQVGRLEGHEPNKCLEDGQWDGDCCAAKGRAICVYGYDLTWSDKVCYEDDSFTAYEYSCTPPGTGGGDN